MSLKLKIRIAWHRLLPVITLLLVATTGGYSLPGLGAPKTCGIKPMLRAGCTVGKCVDGRWQQQCDSSSGLSCGLKPVPRPGCDPARCVKGVWQQDCDSTGNHVCGIKPLPQRDCRVDKCVDGEWQQTCDK